MGPPGPFGPPGEQGPPGKLAMVKSWVPETVFYAGDVVSHGGGTWQATKDTGQQPGGRDWICLAVAGRDGGSITVRGTFDETAEYRRLDVVARNGGSFVALKDAPGRCPGSGWQLLASQGRRGIAGARGERGPRGDPGLSGRDDPRVEGRSRALCCNAGDVGWPRGAAARTAGAVRAIFARDEIAAIRAVGRCAGISGSSRKRT
jgi:hypothetical protein